MSTFKTLYGLSSVSAYTGHKLTHKTGYEIESKEKIGIEVEVENIRAVNHLNKVWQSKNDGSLRNNGIEFVSRPIYACDAPAVLHDLMVESLGADYCFSPRTSVHIHLDMQEQEGEDAINLLMLYTMFERLFYKFVGRGRIKNIYCVPLTETQLIQNTVVQGLRPDRWSKYTGLNLKTLESYGTIEFRHMHGTPDVRKLCVWIDLITKLKGYALKKGTKELRQMVSAIDDDFDFRALLTEIFGSTADFLKYDSFEDVRVSYPIAKQLLARPVNTLSGFINNYSAKSPYYLSRSK